MFNRFFICMGILVLLLIGCNTENPSPIKPMTWPDDLIQLRTNVSESQLVFKIQTDGNQMIHYTVFYNGLQYRQYTRSDNAWSIEFDYSLKDVRVVTVRAEASGYTPYETSILVATDLTEYDFQNNDLDIYYATRDPFVLKALSPLSVQLVSLDVTGDAIVGEFKDLAPFTRLKYISLVNCTHILGTKEDLGPRLSQIELNIN